MAKLSALLCLVLSFAGGAESPQEKPVRETAKISVGKSTVALTYIKPKGYEKSKKFPIVFALPPGDGSAKMVQTVLDSYWETAGFERGYLVVCPEAAYASDLEEFETNVKALVPPIFAWLDKNLSYDKARVVLAGVSNGGSAMFHAAVAHPSRFCGFLGLPAARLLGKPDDLKPLKDKPVWLLVGEKDEGRSDCEATEKALKAAGAVATLEVLEGQNHYLQIDPKKLYDWMDGLKKAR